jgi:hypothetical protein
MRFLLAFLPVLDAAGALASRLAMEAPQRLAQLWRVEMRQTTGAVLMRVAGLILGLATLAAGSASSAQAQTLQPERLPGMCISMSGQAGESISVPCDGSAREKFVLPGAAGGVKCEVKIKAGLEQDMAKKLVKLIKETGLKVQASIQGEEIRLSGKQIDDLRTVMTMLGKADLEVPVQFVNMK